MAVMDNLMHVAAGQLLGRVAQHPRRGLVDKGQPPVQIDAINAVAHRFENQFALPRGQMQRFLGFVLFGHIDAMVEHEGRSPGISIRRLRNAIRR